MVLSPGLPIANSAGFIQNVNLTIRTATARILSAFVAGTYSVPKMSLIISSAKTIKMIGERYDY